MKQLGGYDVELYHSNASSVDEDGFISCQPDWLGEKGGPHIEMLYPYGTYGRPLDPIADKSGTIHTGCPMLVFRKGSKAFCLPMTDLRSVDKVPKIQPGEFINYGPAAQFTRYYLDGTVTDFTTADGTPTGQAIISGAGNKGHIRSGPWGVEKFNNDAYDLRHHSGARVTMGGIGGLPAPFDGISSYIRYQAGSFRVLSQVIALGPGGVPHEPVAKATALTAILTSVGAAMQTLLAVVTALEAVPNGNGAASPTLALAVTAVETAQAGIASAIETISSTSVTVS